MYETTRMVAPGTQFYYFSIDGQVLNADGFPTQPSLDKKLLTFNITSTNYIQNIIKSGMKVSEKILIQMPILPRAPPKLLQGQVRIKTPWDFMMSMFSKYKPDTE